MLKVCQRPELIQQLRHGLIFATDEQVNNVLLTKYSLWDYLTPCDADNINLLNACINQWRDRANQLYETTIYEYDPFNPMHLTETEHAQRTPDLTDETTSDSTSTRSSAGYDIPRTLYDSDKVSGNASTATTRTGTEDNDRHLERSGNLGHNTTQELIEQERQIIIDCLDWYVDKFKQCLTVSLTAGDYECCAPCDDLLDFCAGSEREAVPNSKLQDIDNDLAKLAGSIDDLKKSVADSKIDLAGAISDKGVETAGDATFAEMAENITQISTGTLLFFQYVDLPAIYNGISYVEVTT